ncbi:MAG: transposase [Thaumarchaeota archaeon]|nr:transposase [Nitrososphaerota archaeon]
MTTEPLERDMTSQIDVYESVVGTMEGIVARMLPVSHAPNAVFTEGHLNDGLLPGGVFSSSSSGRTNPARNAHNRIIGRRLAEAEASMPCGEWQRRHLARIRPGTALAAFDEELDANLDLLRGLGLLPDRLDVAIDMHLIPRYDKEHGAELHRSKWKSGTQWFERYFTIQSVTPGVRLVLGALPMPALEDNADYLRKLVTICRGHGIGIGVLMADREFFDTSVMRMLTDEGIDHIIPCRNTTTVVKEINRFAAGVRGTRAEVAISDGRDSVRYTGVVAVRRRRSDGGADHDAPDLSPHERYIMFATSNPDLDVEGYSKRWGIETGYRMIEYARPKTRSKNAELRAFCFLYGIMLFDAWVMFNILHAAQNAADHPGWDGTPVVTQDDMTMYILLRILARTLPPRPPKPPP